MQDKLTFSQKLRDLLSPLVRDIIKEETRNCLRTKKAIVTTAPNGSVCAVRMVGDTTIVTLPYSSATANVAVGDAVWVAILGNNMRTAIVWQKIDFK